MPKDPVINTYKIPKGISVQQYDKIPLPAIHKDFWKLSKGRNMIQDYGKIAYEAYCRQTGNKSLISGVELPMWEALDQKIQMAWNAAGQAVMDARDADLNKLNQAARRGFGTAVESGRSNG